ncbi:MAG: hypothetical protein ACK5NT_12045 [Pyrinomonadaceae bacterium]
MLKKLVTLTFLISINLFSINYELSKSTDDFNSALSYPMDNYNLRLDRGNSLLDQTHKITVSTSFNLFKKLEVAPSYRIESGFPYNVTTGYDNNRDSVFNDRPSGFSRNSERGEFLKQVDVRLQWRFPLRYLGFKTADQTRALRMNLNILNLLNTSNLRNYVGVETSPYFRQATYANPSRSIRFGLFLNF